MRTKKNIGAILTNAICVIRNSVVCFIFVAAHTVVACPIYFDLKKGDDSGMAELKSAPCSGCACGQLLEKKSHNQAGQESVVSAAKENSIETPINTGGL